MEQQGTKLKKPKNNTELLQVFTKKDKLMRKVKTEIDALDDRIRELKRKRSKFTRVLFTILESPNTQLSLFNDIEDEIESLN